MFILINGLNLHFMGAKYAVYFESMLNTQRFLENSLKMNNLQVSNTASVKFEVCSSNLGKLIYGKNLNGHIEIL